MSEEFRVVSAEREVSADAETVFELIADPAQQPRWDGNNNLSSAAPGQRVRAAHDVFVMTNVGDRVRENRVAEFAEGRLIAWLPAPVGEAAPGHLWRWEIEPLPENRVLVRHTYDWTQLHDPGRMERARATTAENLRASIDRLAALAESA
ncbi:MULTISPECIES: SRPBCC family protein [unclassified Leucobacter]|uniref:SRPBCC family protein n=1 Tax=unclassified Leucobacter TaxID=2621730 RepID=UPI00165D40F9|nr:MULTISPECIES: SRPBCC family protein [unclassified Leucobacter]MBC9936270.1 SRPBCC family protein [Leucobacter sp. cx-87]